MYVYYMSFALICSYNKTMNEEAHIHYDTTTSENKGKI